MYITTRAAGGKRRVGTAAEICLTAQVTVAATATTVGTETTEYGSTEESSGSISDRWTQEDPIEKRGKSDEVSRG